MKELILIAVSLLLATMTYSQAPSIAELEAAVHFEPGQIISEPVLLSTSIDYLPNALKEIRFNNAFEFPISIREVPKTVYWVDRLEVEKNEAGNIVDAFSNKVDTSKSIPKKKLQPFNLLKKNQQIGWVKSTETQGFIDDELPFGIQQVNRTVYLTEKVEAHYAKFKKQEALAVKESVVKETIVDQYEKEVVASNSKTSAVTSRGEIINKKELKAIVRRAKGKKSKYNPNDNINDKISTVSTSLASRTVVETPKVVAKKKLVATKIPSNLHKENVNHPENNRDAAAIQPKYESDVVNRELAVLEKMMHADNQKHATTTESNVHIPVTSQPLEVTSQMIDGESVITEIKPVSVSSTSTPSKTIGENRTIKADHFAMATIDNEMVNMDQMRGKVVVLNFWFTTCVECIREVPHLNDLKNRYQGQDIEFVGICLNDKPKIEKFLQKHPFEWKQIPNARKIAHDYYMFIYPGHAVVDKDGGIITLLNGNAPGVMQQLETAIQVGLGETY